MFYLSRFCSVLLVVFFCISVDTRVANAVTSPFALSLLHPVHFAGTDFTITSPKYSLIFHKTSPTLAEVIVAQLGLHDSAKNIKGFQIGVVTLTQFINGIEVGTSSLNAQGLFASVPFLNLGF